MPAEYVALTEERGHIAYVYALAKMPPHYIKNGVYRENAAGNYRYYPEVLEDE
ncbi:MAG: hypothetical protein QXQ41_06895 [Candidatus Bathyarchaeia archaeon]